MMSAVWLGLAGLAQALALAWPWGGQSLPALQIIGMATFATHLVQCQNLKTAFWRSWWFATVWLVGTFWWLFISLHTYGGMNAPLAAVAVVMLAAALALYYAVAGWATAKISGSGKRSMTGSIGVFASAWTLAEVARAVLFTGFPWGAVGYAHVDGVLSSFAPWVGVYGMGWLAAATAMAIAHFLVLCKHKSAPTQGPPAGLMWGGVALASLLVVQAPGHRYVFSSASATGDLQVHLMQGNIGQSEKFQPNTGIAQALRWYQQALLNVNSGLAIAPETALPLLPMHLPVGYWEQLRQHFVSGSAAALVGVPWKTSHAAGEATYSNAAIGWMPEQTQDYRYEKNHLVPFGEFVPPMFRWFTQLMNMPLGDFKAGGAYPATFDWQGQRIAPHICYEDLFGEELARSFIDPARAPTVMVNISNIAWFGDTIAIDQHLNIARLRSLEFQRPMVRATNTGMTAVIDHQGQVTAQLPRHSAGVLVALVEGRADTPTWFAQWASRWHLWPLVVMCALILLWGWIRRFRAPTAQA
jgi:apolipoprotein N-acyltransferase